MAALRKSLGSLRAYIDLPSIAKAGRRLDRRGLPEADPGIESVIRNGVDWLCAAQDNSTSHDGGVARDFSLINGWNSSYPETTGYIIPTLFDCAENLEDAGLRDRAVRMLDWLVSIQRPDGGFQGGLIDQTPVVTVTFNTGQILIGLARGVQELGQDYLEPMRRAAGQLVSSQDPDGCWRKFPTPFARSGEKTYETHVAWGLYEAARVEPDAERAATYAAAASRNVEWALTHQRANGWFDRCCLGDPTAPLTHTLGYVLRGILEAHRYHGDARLLEAARRTADGIASALDGEGFLPGRLDSEWQGRVSYACLTGSAQIAHCWLILYRLTGDARYRDAAYRANAYVRRTVRVEGPAETRGGVKGSFPVNGDYGPYQYLNWACKFLIDSCAVERQVREADDLLAGAEVATLGTRTGLRPPAFGDVSEHAPGQA